MSQIIPFSFNEQPVRVLTIDGEPWFVLADLAKVLQISDVSRLNSRLDDGVRQTHPIQDSMGRTQQATVVNEAGMYEVIIRSDKPEAAAFRRWITSEVLPAIRKHGGYLTPEATEAALTDPDFIIRLATSLKEERAARELAQAKAVELDRQVGEQRAVLALAAPKAQAFDRWLSSNPAYSVDAVAKALHALGASTGRNRLHELMVTRKEDGGLGWTYRVTRGYAPMQAQVEAGRLTVKLGSFENSKTGEVESSSTVRITAKGAAVLAIHFGLLPESVAAQLDSPEGAAA